MIVIWKDTTLKLHGKRHKSDRYYFRWHYGKQRRVCIYKEYVDKPTEAQKTAREEFTELRREVARQLRDADLRAAWERKFKADNQGYKMLHCYVYAMLKKAPSNSPRKGEDCTSSEGAHADNADNANFASWAQTHADGTRRLVKDNAEPVREQRMKAISHIEEKMPKGVHVVVMSKEGEVRRVVITGYRDIGIPKRQRNIILRC